MKKARNPRAQTFVALICIFIVTHMFKNLIPAFSDARINKDGVDFSVHHAPKQQKLKSNPRVAYATLSYGEHLCPVLTATTQIRKVLKDMSVDVIIIRVGDPIPTALMPPGVQQLIVNATNAQGKYAYKQTYSKFYVAHWYQYEVVVFVDSDILLLQPLNHLVQVAMATTPGAVVTPNAYWSKIQATTGTFAVAPAHTGPVTLLDPILQPNSTSQGEGQGEMDWFNNHFKKNLTMVSGIYSLLIDEFAPRSSNNRFNFWGRELKLSPDQLLQQAPSVHFVHTWKPWQRGIKRFNGTMTKEALWCFETWYQVELVACPKDMRSKNWEAWRIAHYDQIQLLLLNSTLPSY